MRNNPILSRQVLAPRRSLARLYIFGAFAALALWGLAAVLDQATRPTAARPAFAFPAVYTTSAR